MVGTGEFTLEGGGPDSKAGFEVFTAMIVDVAGDLYIADGGNQRMRGGAGPEGASRLSRAPAWRASAGTAVRPPPHNSPSCRGWRSSKW